MKRQSPRWSVTLDRILADYGPETNAIRELLKRAYATGVQLLFPDDGSGAGTVDTPDALIRMEGIRAKLWELSPKSESQHWLRSQALDRASEVSSMRWLLLMQRDVSMPMPLLAVLVGWLALIFATFGLLAPRNGTVLTALFVCALSAAGAVLLILEMNQPLSGLMKLSSVPMLDALSNLGR